MLEIIHKISLQSKWFKKKKKKKMTALDIVETSQ